MITVFFRYDDYSALSPTHVDSGLIDTMRRHGVCCTFAVIPAVTDGNYHEAGERDEFVLSGEKLSLLRQAIQDGAVDLALHGWNHRAIPSAPPPTPSEFRGLSLDEQIARIRRGCDFFQRETGVTPQVFVPPWNSYDVNTLHALEQIGIVCISAHRYSPVVDSPDVCYAPMTVEMKDLRAAIEHARLSADPNPVVGVMLHPFDFRESGDPRSSMSLDEFERDVIWLKQCADVKVVSLTELANSGQTLDAARFRDNRPSLETIFPPFVPTVETTPVYLSSPLARRARARRIAMTLAFHTVVALLVFTAVSVLLTMVPPLNGVAVRTLQLLAALGIALLLFRGILAKAVYFRTMLLLSGMSGFCLALLSA